MSRCCNNLAVFLGLLLALGLPAWANTETERLLTSANDFMEQGQYQKALNLLRKARNLDATHASIDRQMRECRIRLGKWVDPDEDNQTLWVQVDRLNLEKVPATKFDSLFQVGRSQEERENYPVALKIYGHLQARDNKNEAYRKAYKDLSLRVEQTAQNHVEVGEVFLKQGQFSKALIEYNRALFFKPDNEFVRSRIQETERRRRELLDSYRTRLTTALAQKEGELAFSIAERAFRDFPKERVFSDAYDSLSRQRQSGLREGLMEARAMLAKGQDDDAESLLRGLQVRYPDDPEVLDLLAKAQAGADARRRTRRADSLDKVFANALEENNITLATQAFAQLRPLLPTPTEVQSRQDRLDGAQTKLSNQREFENLLERAKTSMRGNQLMQARDLLQKALQTNPQSQTTQQLLDDVNREMREAQKSADASASANAAPKPTPTVIAREERKQEYAKTPEDVKKAAELFLEGIGSYRVGDYQNALEKWNRVLKLDPDHEQARKYVENVKLKLSRMN